MPSGALDAIAEQFKVSQKLHLTLLNSLYMIGYVLGPLIFGPLSEYIGRRPVMIGTFLGYLAFMLACSGAPTYGTLLALRLLCGINAAAPTTVISGLYADILDNPSHRGFALSMYMTVTTFGPMFGPIISGYSSPASWRWPSWAAGLIAAPGLPIVLTIPETYAPVLYNKMIQERVKNGNHASGGQSTEPQPFNVRKIFLRPMTLLVTEPILFSTAIYLALAYSVFYLLFQAYPIVYQGVCVSRHCVSVGVYADPDNTRLLRTGSRAGSTGVSTWFVPPQETTPLLCKKNNIISSGHRRDPLHGRILPLQQLLRQVSPRWQTLGAARDQQKVANCMYRLALVKPLYPSVKSMHSS